ncbi:MAG: hypothetical protein RLY58_1270 [Pseudomonadota bacterium]
MDNLIDQLPESLQNIVKLTDLDAALTLVDKHGGTTFHVPPLKMMHPQHDLACLIGVDHALKLCRYYSGDSIYLPRASHYLQAIRDEKIRDEADHLTTAALALKYKLSERWIRKIKSSTLQNVTADERQLGLF